MEENHFEVVIESKQVTNAFCPEESVPRVIWTGLHPLGGGVEGSITKAENKTMVVLSAKASFIFFFFGPYTRKWLWGWDGTVKPAKKNAAAIFWTNQITVLVRMPPMLLMRGPIISVCYVFPITPFSFLLTWKASEELILVKRESELTDLCR